ncbi:TolC family protein, partial [Gemmatimonadota bacterium]
IVINAVRAVEGAMRQMEILEEQLQIAQTSYTISQQQYGRGNITLTELLRAQDDWNSAQNSHLQALIDYETAKATLKENTMWDWETNQPVLQQTTPPVPFGKNG